MGSTWNGDPRRRIFPLIDDSDSDTEQGKPMSQTSTDIQAHHYGEEKHDIPQDARPKPAGLDERPRSSYVIPAKRPDFRKATFEKPVDQVEISRLRSFSGSTLVSISSSQLTKPDTVRTRKEEILEKKSWRKTSKPATIPTPEAIAMPDENTIEGVLEAISAAVPPHLHTIAEAVQKHRSLLAQQVGRHTFEPFRPSYNALQNMGLFPGLETIRATLARSRVEVSDNYRGDINVSHNRSANIPDDQNCSLWLVGLPAYVTYTALLASIRRVGKVAATFINPPIEQYNTSAAKVVFFNRASAEKLFNRIMSGNFRVLGQPISLVRWNQIKVGEFYQPEHSRVIRITGPGEAMDKGFFELFFKTRFTYDLDQNCELPSTVPGTKVFEWHFSSLYCQAASAKTALEREFGGVFTVEWARDPCA
jgi:hypothetical protein